MGLFGNRKEEVHVVSFEKDEQQYADNVITESLETEHSTDTIGDIYMIDFENVHDEGFCGIETLSPNDKVVVFYGNLNKMISLDAHLSVLQSKAQIENLQLGKSAKNYLDFQLVTYLGYLLGTGNYKTVYIVSKDTGFDSVVDFWNARNITIERRPAIIMPEKVQPTVVDSKEADLSVANEKKPEQKKVVAKQQNQNKSSQKKAEKKSTPEKDVPETTRKKIRAALQNQKLAGSNYTSIYRAFATAKNKNAYDTSLRKALGQVKGADVYAATKAIWNEGHM